MILPSHLNIFVDHCTDVDTSGHLDGKVRCPHTGHESLVQHVLHFGRHIRQVQRVRAERCHIFNNQDLWKLCMPRKKWFHTKLNALPSGCPIEGVGIDNFVINQRFDVPFRIHLRKIGEVDDQWCRIDHGAHSFPVVVVILGLLGQSEMDHDTAEPVVEPVS